MYLDVASLSTRGQFVIPSRFRRILKLKTGSKLAIVCDGKHLLLRPIPRPETKAFKAVIDGANELAKQAAAKKTKGGRK
jgi:bifunctional DNA-binding transcriptional regulator/antitoxin component of YhaV-PrlF toxin-antitoxin module